MFQQTICMMCNKNIATSQHLGILFCARCWSGCHLVREMPVLAPLAQSSALFLYEGPVRSWVLSLKYRQNRHALFMFARAMSALSISVTDSTIVTWIPTTSSRRFHRGFDQAEYLAQAVAYWLGISCVSLLHRVSGDSQTTKSLHDRQFGQRPSTFTVKKGRIPNEILLVDDVFTTGTTCMRAAQALQERNDVTIRSLCFALASRRRP